MARRARKAKTVKALTHGEASRKNIPTAEHEPVMEEDLRSPIEVAYERRNRDLDPQLVWRGKDEQNWSDLVVQAPPLFIQEKVHPKALIADLLRHSKEAERERAAGQPGVPDGSVRRLQRPAEPRRANGVLPARRELVEPNDPRRQPPSHGLPRGARGPSRQSAVHLPRPAVRHQVSTRTSSGRRRAGTSRTEIPTISPPNRNR